MQVKSVLSLPFGQGVVSMYFPRVILTTLFSFIFAGLKFSRKFSRHISRVFNFAIAEKNLFL